MRGWRLLLAGLHLDVGNSVLVRVLDQVPFLVILLHSLLDDTGIDVVDGNSLRGRRTPQLEVGCPAEAAEVRAPGDDAAAVTFPPPVSLQLRPFAHFVELFVKLPCIVLTATFEH